MTFWAMETATRTSVSQIHSWEKARSSSRSTSQIPRPTTTAAAGPMSRGPTHPYSRARGRTAVRSRARLARAIIAFMTMTPPTQMMAARTWKNISHSWSSTAPALHQTPPENRPAHRFPAARAHLVFARSSFHRPHGGSCLQNGAAQAQDPSSRAAYPVGQLSEPAEVSNTASGPSVISRSW